MPPFLGKTSQSQSGTSFDCAESSKSSRPQTDNPLAGYVTRAEARLEKCHAELSKFLLDQMPLCMCVWFRMRSSTRGFALDLEELQG
jgi:hypothetical protein